MNHAEATATLAVERYLLKEMTPEERDAFEGHLFECVECGAGLRAGESLVARIRRMKRMGDAFSIEEARESARAHATAAARLRSEMKEDGVAPRPLEKLAVEHERTGATMRAYVATRETLAAVRAKALQLKAPLYAGNSVEHILDVILLVLDGKGPETSK